MISSSLGNFKDSKSESKVSPIMRRKSLKREESDDKNFKTSAFISSHISSSNLQSENFRSSTQYPQSEPMLTRRLPKLTLPDKIIPASTTQQNRKLKKKMDRDNWRLNQTEQRRSKYYPDNSFRLLNQMNNCPINLIPGSSGQKDRRFSWLPSPSNCEYKLNRCSEYSPGKRCGIIPVDTEIDSQGRKVVSLLVVMGRPTMLEKGRPMNIWSFGKGRMMENETEEKCAIREFWEETGIRISTVSNLPRIELGKNVYFILHTSRKSMPTEQLAIKDVMEVQDVAWKTVEELREIEKRVCPNQRVNKDVRAIIKYPIRSFHYHKFIFNPEPKHVVQDVRELPTLIADSNFVKIGNQNIEPCPPGQLLPAS